MKPVLLTEDHSVYKFLTLATTLMALNASEITIFHVRN